jgi:hypothetical protein
MAIRGFPSIRVERAAFMNRASGIPAIREPPALSTPTIARLID